MNARDTTHFPSAAHAVALIGCGPKPRTPDVPPPEAIGFKAHNLARMAAMGLPVPPAFVLGTGWCADPAALRPEVWQPALAALEHASDARFGDARQPLLLSVRSGAPVSMPGMMETLLNIGLCDATLPGFLRATGNPRLVWDAYRRLVAGFGEVVLGIDAAVFEADLAQIAAGRDERELDFAELRALTRAHLASVQRVAGQPFPQSPRDQLTQAIAAVFASWQAPKARDYRRLNGIADSIGTAVTVQRMVFGNAGGTSGAGVGFTRHPLDRRAGAVGRLSVQRPGRGRGLGPAQRAGPRPAGRRRAARVARAAGRHAAARAGLRRHEDFEFTVENGRLWLLQTRAGKRTAQATARIALDLADEGVISLDEARRRTEGLGEDQLAVPRVVTEDGAAQPLAQAVSAAHGVAIGEIVLDEAAARARQAAGATVLLLRQDAETRDLAALDIAAGLLTARGARTSHAAVVARQLGKVCLVGCEQLVIDTPHRRVRLGGEELAEGEVLTLDGGSGAVYQGSVRTVREVPQALMERLAALRKPA